MAGRFAEQRITQPVGFMRWEHVSFLHWSYDAEVLRPLLPRGLKVDTWEGRAWVGLVPFVMAGVRPRGLPRVPGISTFPEFNVRTYVRDADGRDGLLFLTLEASQPLMLSGRPALGLGYTLARMRVSRRGTDVGYASRRLWPRNPVARLRLVVATGAPMSEQERMPFDDWLTGRWRAFSRVRGRLLATPVEHEPWPLHHATVPVPDTRLLVACGLPQPAAAPIVHYAPGVTVRMGVPRAVG